MPASEDTQEGGLWEGPCRALRGAAESGVYHIHHFSETHNYKPSHHLCPGAVIGSLWRSRSSLFTTRWADTGCCRRRLGTDGRGPSSLSQIAGHTQNAPWDPPKWRSCHNPFHWRLPSEIESPGVSARVVFLTTKTHMERAELELSSY